MKDYLFTAIRYYVIFVSSVLLFFLFVRRESTPKQDFKKFIEQAIQVMIIVAVIQVFIGALIYYFPDTGSWFRPFLKADEEMLAVAVTDESIGGINRFRTLIAGPEPTGEMLMVLAPLVLYKYLSSRNMLYLVVLIIFGCTQLLTVTRSTIFMFALAIVSVLLFHARQGKVRVSIQVALGLIFVALLSLLIFPQIFDGFLRRVALVKDNVDQERGLSTILNRDIVWSKAAKNLENLPALGHGFIPPSLYQYEKRNFHCLYLTSLYQMGWLGASVFFIFLLWIYTGLFKAQLFEKDLQLRLLQVCCLIAFTVFLMNEIKYEFSRHASYQQFCWALMGLFYCVSSFKKGLAEK